MVEQVTVNHLVVGSNPTAGASKLDTNSKLKPPLPPLMNMMNPQETTDNKAIRELRNEVIDLNKTLRRTIKTTNRFSKAFLILALIQVFIGFYGFTYSALTEQTNKWYGLGWIILLAVAIYSFLRLFPSPKDD